MQNSVYLTALGLVLSLWLTTLILLSLRVKDLKSQMSTQTTFFSNQLTNFQTQNQMLMDRIQSGDLKTFLSLQTNNNSDFGTPFPNALPQSDQAELERLGRQGVGYPLYDDDSAPDAELAATLSEFGLDDFSE